MKPLRKLPRFKLDLPGIMLTADEQPKTLSYVSDIRGLGYVEDTKRLLIMTASNGYICLKAEDVLKLADELQYIHGEMVRRQR